MTEKSPVILSEEYRVTFRHNCLLWPNLGSTVFCGGEGVDGNIMPMLGPQAIPEPQVKSCCSSFKPSSFHLSLQKQVAGSNGENIQIEKKVTSELEAETVKICWNCHAPKETTKLFKCKGCHKVGRFLLFLILTRSSRRATVGRSARGRTGRGMGGTVLSSWRGKRKGHAPKISPESSYNKFRKSCCSVVSMSSFHSFKEHKHYLFSLPALL